jgi:hypothetical protein
MTTKSSDTMAKEEIMSLLDLLDGKKNYNNNNKTQYHTLSMDDRSQSMGLNVTHDEWTNNRR